ncbi:MAG: hypothetical protein H6739_07925 [Alphaproteobacteria bacterium]|nr:hypothetical protein [Alphaproteobacteria bacterium]
MLAPLLLLATAQAGTIDVTFNDLASGETFQWTEAIADQGPTALTLAFPDHTGELALLVTALEEDQVQLDLEVWEVRARRLRADKRELLSQPRLLTRHGAGCSFTVGTRAADGSETGFSVEMLTTPGS